MLPSTGSINLPFRRRTPAENIRKQQQDHPSRKKTGLPTFNQRRHFYGGDVVTLDEDEDPDVMHHPFEPLKSLHIKHLKKEALL